MSKPVIICVDDEQTILNSLKIELSRTFGRDYKIEPADGGEDALELLTELREDGLEVVIAISDYLMPSMKGDELLRRIHDISPQTIKIMLTGQADIEAVGRAIKYAKLYRYVAKPWQSEDLILTVQEGIYSYLREKKVVEQTLRLQHLNQELEKLNLSLEEKVAERTAELQQAKEAADVANHSKSYFLARISHELRTPMNAILGFAQVMKHDRDLKLEQQHNLEIITAAGEHLLTLINDILEWSKIEANKVTLEVKFFDIYQLIESIRSLFSLQAKEKNIQMDFEIDPQVPQYIIADELKLRQVLINLLGNALKFTREGGIELRVTCCTIEKDREQSVRLLFAVEDTGFGIGPEEIDRIFEAFGQTEIGRKHQQGTGLGLAISRKFVQLMGGEITVSSTEGKGSIFKFDIKVDIDRTKSNGETENVSLPSCEQAIAGKSKEVVYRILVVEDMRINRKVILKMLDKYGFEIREAVNGEEAVDLFQNWNPHLILMDIQMPIMDGYEATKKIKALKKDTPIIALTAHAFEEDREAVFAAGCDDFISKPVSEKLLLKKVAELLGLDEVCEE